MTDAVTVAALRNSSKGKLYYNRSWQEEEGRTKELLDAISVDFNCLNVSPKALALLTTSSVSLDDVRTPASSKTPIVQSPESILLSKVKSPSDSFDEASYLLKLNETELSLLEYENERHLAAQELCEQKQKEYDEFSRTLARQFQLKYEYVRNNCSQDLETEQQIDDHGASNQQHFLVSLKNEFETSDRNSSQEIERTQEEENMRMKEQKTLKQELLSLKDNFIPNVAFQIEEILSSCKNKQYLQTLPSNYMQRLMAISNVINDTILGAKSGAFTLHADTNVKAFVTEVKKLLQSVLDDVYQANMRTSQNSLQQSPIQPLFQSSPKNPSVSPHQHLVHQMPEPVHQLSPSSPEHIEPKIGLGEPIPETSQQEQEDMMESNVPEPPNEYPQPLNNHTQVTLPSRTESMHVVDMDECDTQANEQINETAKQEKQELASHLKTVREYFDKIEYLKQIEKSVESFSTNPKHKKYKMDLSKAVSIPINAISSCTGSHLRDKINRLISLLSGQTVSIGAKHTSCLNDPDALAYCKKLIAEKFVKQGEEEVASKFSAAFTYAAMIVSVCAKFPDIWLLVLGNFYRKCPYLVPFLPPQEDGQSDTDYYVTLGYKCNDDKVEDTENFLKRMSGFMRLYSAILLTTLLPGFSASHLHSIKHGWMWMANTLNRDPQPDVTATLLFDFLEVLGHFLEKHYGKQFKKLLHVLCTDFFQKIKLVSPSGSTGPISRLEFFLQSSLKKRQISQPKDILPAHFWKT